MALQEFSEALSYSEMFSKLNEILTIVDTIIKATLQVQVSYMLASKISSDNSFNTFLTLMLQPH